MKKQLYGQMSLFDSAPRANISDTGVHDLKRLQELQALPLDRKIMITQTRIIEWYTRWKGQVYVSFSGGKDSTVLLHIARQCFPDIEAVFVNTGLEYPELRKFVKSFDNVTILHPELRFDEVIKKYGYPVISKVVSEAIFQTRRNMKLGNTDTVRYKQLHGEYMTADGTQKSLYNKSKYKPLLYSDIPISSMCCDIMKKMPTKKYGRQTGKYPILAQLAEESRKRTDGWINSGCNGFHLKYPQSNPMAFWKEQDILEYISRYNLPIAPVYGDVVLSEDGCEYCTTGCNRTGCIFCAYGAHLEKESRFLRLKETHPRQYEYCIGGGEYGWIGWIVKNARWKFIDFVNEDGPMPPEEIEEFINEHKDDENYVFERVWMPNKQGLGMGHVFDEINKIYGEKFIRYK